MNPKLDWLVQYANDDQEAFDLVDEIFADVVVTDLQMPTMTGIELCAKAHADHPTVPIILMTGQGNEELALESLKAGAVSYITKNSLAESLISTVEQVISISKRVRSQDPWLRQTKSCQFEFDLASDPTLMESVVDCASDRMTKLKLGDETEERQVCDAFEEALMNANFHGHLGMDPQALRLARQARLERRAWSGELAD